MAERSEEKLAGSVGLVETSHVTLFEPPDLLQLECGQTLGPIQVAYETYGELNDARDNAVLICHALTGDAHVAGYHSLDDRKPGWWEDMAGPGKGVDTDKYFVICSNILGGCKGTTGPGSINPDTGKQWGLSFPVITIEDIVKVQKRLVEFLGIEKLLAVMGGSLGGMQVLEWAVRYPDSVKAALAIATTSKLSAQSIAFDAVGRNAILADAGFKNGEYDEKSGPERGLAIARMVGHITYLSEEGMHRKFGRQLRHADEYSYDFNNEFSVETYLEYQGKTFVERFDANSYLYITKAMDYYDLGGRFGSLAEAVGDIQADVLVISFSSDWLFPPRQSRDIVDALLSRNKRVSYSEITSPYGHDAFLLEPEVVGRLVSGFIAGAYGKPVLQTTAVHQPYRKKPAVETSWTRIRVDYDCIEEMIEPHSTVLDLGCGRGELLSRLMTKENVSGLGVEVNQAGICECVDRAIPVVDLNIEKELASFADNAYDYVVLSQTLQTLRNAEVVLDEMLRIGRKCIVSFPNFGYWKPRLQMLLRGKTPVSESLPFRWYDTPNIHFVTISDFEEFCKERSIRIINKIPLTTRTRNQVRLFPNLRAEEAVFVLSSENP